MALLTLAIMRARRSASPETCSLALACSPSARLVEIVPWRMDPTDWVI